MWHARCLLPLTLVLLRPLPAAADEIGSVAGEVLTTDGAGPIWVYLATAPGPAAEVPPRARLELVEESALPAFLVARRGQWLDVAVRGPGLHLLHVRGAGTDVRPGPLLAGQQRAVELRAPGEVELRCEVHPHTAVRILVLPGPHVARVRSGGRFVLSDVPAGRQQIAAWSPWHEPQQREVEVPPGAWARLDLTLVPRRGPTW